MEYAIDHRPSFAQLTVSLDPDEQLVAEAGALVAWLAPKLPSRQASNSGGQ